MVTTAGKAPPGRILKTTNASNAQQEILATLSQRHLRKLRRNHELPDAITAEPNNYLCNVGRDTCFRVWHLEWNNGSDIPRELVRNHKMRDRAPIKPGKKRRRRQRLSGDQPSVGSDGIEEGGK
ncbi:hypothetical protein L916_05707 [Phytophthora nicotianae]|uniref:Uncharacterized protein n=1 Tax=Phytophthora nicotianae TaxID=4792 RepID=W2JDS0_PHYNI|nr:hypothetical protein L916_05707 [Phytophthora nicotianae]